MSAAPVPTSAPVQATACDEVACAPPGVHPLDGDLGFALAIVFRSYQEIVKTAMADVPGGPRGYQVLATATHDLPRTQLALAQQLAMDRTVMTYLLDDLETAGLVERRPDPTDRRARRIIVTETGCALLAALHERLRQAEEHVLRALPPDERSTFRALLSRLATDIAAAQPAVDACQVVEDIGASAAEVKPPAARRRPRR